MNLPVAREALKKYFGYDQFRPLQAEIIDSVLKGKDSLILMPTGGGKSVCFQIPALIRPGMGVVVSPLISLMKDQVEGLKANGIRAAFLNSSQTYAQQQAIIEEVLVAEIQLLYVSPEKVVSSDFLNLIREVKISLFAIDEAHCISSWGHDFRPEYTQLNFLKQQFPDVPMIALTATADKLTRRDIVQQLQLHKPKLFLASFDRPNLSLSVLPGHKRLQVIKDFIRLRPNQSGIIYCLSRKETERLSAKLNEMGVKAGFYHAGLGPGPRAKVQEDFINDEVPIICATIAFGMGIDKSNVRWVIHYNMPKNIEGYYQEIGRAGRDGLKSDTLLFYSYGDVIQLRQFAEDSGQPEVQISKLDRMQAYAEAAICRRKILLNYFGEHLADNCGNCDVCENPPQQFEGTVLAQKALSAVARTKEQIGVPMLIDILRGSNRKELLERSYHKIKTYGAGADMPSAQWQDCLLQMLHLGLVEIAYDQGNVLRLTPASWQVLKGERTVQLVQFQNYKDRFEQQKERVKPKSPKQIYQETLFQELVALRADLAKKAGLAPYLVFTDATLKVMSEKLPTTPQAMQDISGVGEAKNKQYGKVFRQQILDFILQEAVQGTIGFKPQGLTYLLTLFLYRQGKDTEEIVRQRKLSPDTIYNHYLRLYQDGYSIRVEELLSPAEWQQLRKAVARIGFKAEVKPYFSLLEGDFMYGKIRLGVAYLQAEVNASQTS